MDIKASQRLITLREMSLEAQLQLFRLLVVLLLQGFPDGLQGLYSRNFGENRLFKVACGASDYDYAWTRTMMQKDRDKMDGLSLHYYTCKGWTGSKGSATDFTPEEYYNVLAKSVEIDEVLRNHEAIMDAFDPEKRVALLLDEWGTWFDVEPGYNPGHLFQQNTMRDAMVAALSLNIFQKHTDRLKMANIAQIVNVLQAMILTKGPQMVLTPTYHVFRMFNVHQNATYVPSEYSCGTFVSAEGRVMENFSACASRDAAGALHVSLANPSLDGERNARIYQTVLIVLGLACMTAYCLLCWPSVLHWLWVLSLPLYFLHLRGVWTRSGKALDPMLPLLVMTTFALSLLTGLGFCAHLL